MIKLTTVMLALILFGCMPLKSDVPKEQLSKITTTNLEMQFSGEAILNYTCPSSLIPGIPQEKLNAVLTCPMVEEKEEKPVFQDILYLMASIVGYVLRIFVS